MKKINTLLSVLIALAIISTACVSTTSGEPPRNAEIIHVVASTNLQAWLDEAANEFNKLDEKSPQGHPYFVQITYVDAGQAVTENLDADLWIPDNETWVELMADLGNANYLNNCQSTVQSPLVIAMWRPLAEALGWPSHDLGWLDIGSLAADPSAWEYYSGGQFGNTFRLGHAHPGLSAAGTNTLLAVVHAAQAKQDAVEVREIEEPIVQASVSAFESSVSTFSRNTVELNKLMQQRGDSFLNATVVYENLVYESSQQGLNIIPVYPFEGTFVADFPACLNASVSEETHQGGLAFRDFLLSQNGQQLAVDHGLRPSNLELPDETTDESVFDWQMPEIVFANPSIETIYAIQDLWQSSRKAVNLVMVIDTSTSMSGTKLESVKQAAGDFVEAMGKSDYITILYYDLQNKIVPLVYHTQIEGNRQQITQAISELRVKSNTPLFDSIGISAEVIEDTNSSQTSNVMMILTDGQDTASKTYKFDQNLIDQATSNNTTIYSIAFGNDADEELLQDLAFRANGNFYIGTQANIASIYGEMSVLFGGSAGIGR